MRKESFLLSLTTPCQPDRINSMLLCFVIPCEVPNTRNGRAMLLEKKKYYHVRECQVINCSNSILPLLIKPLSGIPYP